VLLLLLLLLLSLPAVVLLPSSFVTAQRNLL
jgi:hypothetical protein